MLLDPEEGLEVPTMCLRVKNLWEIYTFDWIKGFTGGIRGKTESCEELSRDRCSRKFRNIRNGIQGRWCDTFSYFSLGFSPCADPRNVRGACFQLSMSDGIPYNGTQCSGDDKSFLELLVVELEFKSILVPSNVLFSECNVENNRLQRDFAITALDFKGKSEKSPR